MYYINIQIDTYNHAFDDQLTEELGRVLNAREIVNGLCELPMGATTIDLFTSDGAACGCAWASEKPLKEQEHESDTD